MSGFVCLHRCMHVCIYAYTRASMHTYTYKVRLMQYGKNTNRKHVYATFAFIVFCSDSLLASRLLCLSSTPEASPDTAAKPTTQPARPLSSKQHTLSISVWTAYALVCLCSLFGSFIQCRVPLMRQANALAISSTSIWEDKTVSWKHGRPESAVGKLDSALTPALFMCFRDIVVSPT